MSQKASEYAHMPSIWYENIASTAPVAAPALEEPVDDTLGTDEHAPTARKKAPARHKTANTTAPKMKSIASPKKRDVKAPVVEPEPKRPRRSTRTT
ncbi:hypothetical protein N9D08_01785 [bacterium]|nr:hypothetical protein [bacterium]